MEQFWAALYSTDNGGAPFNCIWTLQIIHALRWFKAFFDKEGNHLERFFSLDASNRKGTAVEIGTDASPWGLGGWLSIDGQIQHFFACSISKEDVALSDTQIGDSDGQQLWVCLAIIVAVDMWHSIRSQSRIILKVRGDNVFALTMLIKMRPSGPNMAVIARELALRVVELSSFHPDATHTRGVAHVIADRLSRVFMPGGTGIVDKSIHACRAEAKEAVAFTRDDSWYRAYARDPSSNEASGQWWALTVSGSTSSRQSDFAGYSDCGQLDSGRSCVKEKRKKSLPCNASSRKLGIQPTC